MRTKIISVLVVALLAVSLLAGCNATVTPTNAPLATPTPVPPVTINVMMRNHVGTAQTQVQDALNALPSVKAINVIVNLVLTPQGTDYKQYSTLALAANENIDILFDASWLAYSSRVAAGAYADITTYVDKYTKLKGTLPQTLWTAASLHGKIYSVPTYKEVGESYGLYVPTAFLTANSIDATKVKDLASATDLLKSLVAKGHAGFMVKYGDTALDRLTMMQTYDVVDGQYSLVVNHASGSKVENYFATANFSDYCKLMKSWYTDGLIAKDVLTKEDYKDVETNPDKYGMGMVGYAPQAEVIASIANGFPTTYLPISGVYATTNNCLGSVWAVNAKSKNIDKSVALLEVWNTDPAFKNLITYGVEGVTYKLTDGQVDYSSFPNQDTDELWSSSNWMTGNEYISYTLKGETKDKWAAYKAYSDTAKPSSLLGFSFATAKVDAEYTAVVAVIKEYLPLLSVGVVDNVDAKIADFNAALKAAGMDKVVAEAQSQIDAFNAK